MAGANGAKRPLVLVVEAERSVLNLLRAILHSDGLDSVGANGREEALQLARDVYPDLFLIDLGWPGQRDGGVALAQALRRSGFMQTPMIVLSASPLITEATKTGLFQAKIEKPFSAEDVSQVVKKLLDR